MSVHQNVLAGSTDGLRPGHAVATPPARAERPRFVGVPEPGQATVTVVVPTLNEERNIAWVLERMPDCVGEVIIVDGFSSDRTIDAAKGVRPDAVVIQQRGRGKGAALRTGFEAASGDYIIAIDADGSMEPGEIDGFAPDACAQAVYGYARRQPTGTLLLLNRASKASMVLQGMVSARDFDEFEQRLASKSTVRLVYHNPDARIYRIESP